MGAVTFSLDENLLIKLKSVLDLDLFVETGTFKGDTIADVQSHFSSVISIELSNELYRECANRFEAVSHVRVVHGNSEEKLRELRTEYEHKPTLFWLDAHWCVATDTAGEMSQCPLLGELDAIGKLEANSVVLIDDARLFLAPPLSPHEISDWPSFDAIVRKFLSMSDAHEIMVVNDVIAFYPGRARLAMVEYGQKHGTDWLDVYHWFKQKDAVRTDMAEKDALIVALHNAANPHADVKDEDAAVETLSGVAKQSDGLEEKDRWIEAVYDSSRQDSDAAEQDALVHLLSTSSKMKDDQIEVLTEELQLKETVIRELARTLQRYNSRRALSSRIPFAGFVVRRMRRLKTILQPRLGNLNQYSARPLTTLAERTFRPGKSYPKISIVTPSYGQVAYIERTLLSVLNQNYPNLEYFVQDGGSKDGTADVLESYQDVLSGWESKKDNGQSHAINIGFTRTSGEIMGWLNSDDILLPGSLAVVAEFFNRHPDVDVVYGNRLLIDENDMEIGRWIMPGHDSAALSWADYIPQETVFWRRAIWEKAGGKIDESYLFAMDWDLLVRFRDAGAKFAHIPRFLGAFRIHEHQKTSAAISDIGFKEMDRIRERTLGHIPSRTEIQKALVGFLLRHVGTDMAYRVKTRMKR